MAFDLKSETDVKDYIERLGVEYRFGCYSEKKPEGGKREKLVHTSFIQRILISQLILVCHLLGDYLESIKKDFEKASKVYRSNCDDYGYGRSCLKFGHYSFLGKGKASGSDKGDAKQAYKYYERGCELKDADCCLHSGLIMVSKSMSSAIEGDVAKGFDSLMKSCKMDNGNACFYLSGMHISGVLKKEKSNNTTTTATASTNPTDFIVQKDMKKAFDYASRACELNNMYACANLSQMYMRGDGTEKNEKKAEQFKKKALEMQEELKKQQAELKFQQGIA